MSATAGCGVDKRIEESARAAEKAWRGFALLVLVFSWLLLVVVEQLMVMLGLVLEAKEPYLGFVMGLARFVGMVRDMFSSFSVALVELEWWFW